MTKYLPAHIANFFLWKAEEEGVEDMTPMKLIKLVYFSYAWYLAIFNKKIFDEKIEAWRYGPVIPSIYHEFKRFGNSPIKQFAINFEPETGETSYPIIDQNDTEILQVAQTIWNFYKDKSGDQLSQITHQEHSPWHCSYLQGENNPISDDKIIKRAKEAILKHQKQQKNEQTK